MSPGRRSWPPGASRWPSYSCLVGGRARYTQSAPLALAPSTPEAALAGTAGLGHMGGGAQLAVPLALTDAPADAGQPGAGEGAQLAALDPSQPQGSAGRTGWIRAPPGRVCPGGSPGAGGPGTGPGTGPLHLPRPDAAGPQAGPRGTELRPGGLARHGLWLALWGTSVLSSLSPPAGSRLLQTLFPGRPCAMQRGS